MKRLDFTHIILCIFVVPVCMIIELFDDIVEIIQRRNKMESDKEMDIINCVEIKQVTHGTTHVYYQISTLRKTNVEAHEVASRINGEATKEALANRMGEVMKVVDELEAEILSEKCWDEIESARKSAKEFILDELKSRLNKLGNKEE